MNRNAPIGVFDSGLGGLTVVGELARTLPNEKIIYLGDIARLPYGIKSDRQIKEFSKENTNFLRKKHVKAVVIACNSSSSAAFNLLKKQFSFPVIDVIGPAAKQAAQTTRNDRIGVMATQATVTSRAYERAIKKINPKLHVFSNACPLLVPLVEEGVLNGQVTRVTLKRYLTPLLAHKIDTLILGCTHYPLLRDAIQKAVGRRVTLVDSAPAVAEALRNTLAREKGLQTKNKKEKVDLYVTDTPHQFQKIGARFLGHSLGRVHVVTFEGAVARNGRWVG